MLRRRSNTPVHAIQDHAAYFITSAIYGKRRLLRDAALKQMLIELLQQHFPAYGWRLDAWVILDNHYHLMAQSDKGEDLPTIIRKIHSTSAIAIHGATACGLPVWWNYWDYCPRDEREYYTRLNYLLYNPVRHGYVSDLKNYPYSSFHALFQSLGKEPLARRFRNYAEFRTLDLEDDF